MAQNIWVEGRGESNVLRSGHVLKERHEQNWSREQVSEDERLVKKTGAGKEVAQKGAMDRCLKKVLMEGRRR